MNAYFYCIFADICFSSAYVISKYSILVYSAIFNPFASPKMPKTLNAVPFWELVIVLNSYFWILISQVLTRAGGKQINK